MSRAKRAILCGILVGLALGSGALLLAQAPVQRAQAPPPPAPAPPQPAWWTGHNAVLDDYYVRPGYPLYEPHARYLGGLKGTWRERRVQDGQRAGDLIRLVFEAYYDQIVAAVQDSARIVPDARLLGEYHAKLVPEAVEFMKGPTRPHRPIPRRTISGPSPAPERLADRWCPRATHRGAIGRSTPSSNAP